MKEARSIVVRDLTTNTRDKEFKEAVTWLLKISASVYNELIDVVFSRNQYNIPPLVHHGGPSKGIVLTTYEFSITNKRGTLTETNPSKPEYLYVYLFNHDINGNVVAGGSDDSIHQIIKNKYATYVQTQVFNNMIDVVWSMFRSAASLKPERHDKKDREGVVIPRPEKESYPKQRVYSKKEFFKATLKNCPYNSQDKTITLVNPIKQSTKNCPLPAEMARLYEIFKENLVIDLTRTVDALPSGNLKFTIGVRGPDIVLNMEPTGDINFTLAHSKATVYKMPSNPALGYLTWDDEEFNKLWKKYEKTKDKLPENERLTKMKFYLKFLSEGDDSILVIDPNVNRIAMVVVKEGKLIDTINLDISPITFENEINRHKTADIRRKLAKNTGNVISTSREQSRHHQRMVDFRTNFQHNIVVAIMEIAEKYDIKHLLFGSGGKSRRGMKHLKNIKNLSFNNITKYLQERARERGMVFCEVTEYYTSKASFLDGEIPVKDSKFSAIRGIKDRHMLTRDDGSTVDADVNAACNIAVRHGVLDNAVRKFRKVRHMIHNPKRVELQLYCKTII